MDSSGIRAWLLCQPRPGLVKITDGDKVVHEFKLKEGITWRAAADSIHALQPEQIEAFDKDGDFLRAIRPREVEEEDPETIEVVTDSETNRFVVVAKLLADAYKHSTTTAFDKMTSMFDAMNRRAEVAEHSLEAMERMMRKQWETQILADAQDASGNGGPITMEGLIAAFMQGQVQAKAKAAAKEVVNGAATTTKEGEDNG